MKPLNSFVLLLPIVFVLFLSFCDRNHFTPTDVWCSLPVAPLKYSLLNENESIDLPTVPWIFPPPIPSQTNNTTTTNYARNQLRESVQLHTVATVIINQPIMSMSPSIVMETTNKATNHLDPGDNRPRLNGDPLNIYAVIINVHLLLVIMGIVIVGQIVVIR